MTEDDTSFFETLRVRLEIARKGSEQYEARRKELERQFLGKFVVIEPSSGQFVIGKSSREARAEFKRRFGNDTLGFEEHIGEPLIARAGAWAV